MTAGAKRPARPEAARTRSRTMSARHLRPSGDLAASLETRGDTVVLDLRGAAGLDESELLDAAVSAVLDEEPRVVIVHLAGMYFLTSLAIRAFLRLHTALAGRDGFVRIAGASADLTDVLTRTEIHRVIPLFESVEAALAAPRIRSNGRAR
jgi:anti-anti-sigma factor